MSSTVKLRVLDYQRKDGKRPFYNWLAGLDLNARAKVQIAVARIRKGGFSNVKSVGRGVYEYRINFGPGYRIYFGRDGEKVVILLGGGTKKRQTRDVETSKELWKEYKARKREGDIQWH